MPAAEPLGPSPRPPAPRRALLVIAALLGSVAAVACGQVVAGAPPSTSPAASEVVVVAGSPVVVAARAARTLRDHSFSTKRFGADSTWALRAVDTTAVRLRYTRPSDDSTRVLVELWGRCARQRACASGAIASLVEGMSTADAPPP